MAVAVEKGVASWLVHLLDEKLASLFRSLNCLYLLIIVFHVITSNVSGSVAGCRRLWPFVTARKPGLSSKT